MGSPPQVLLGRGEKWPLWLASGPATRDTFEIQTKCDGRDGFVPCAALPECLAGRVATFPLRAKERIATHCNVLGGALLFNSSLPAIAPLSPDSEPYLRDPWKASPKSRFKAARPRTASFGCHGDYQAQGGGREKVRVILSRDSTGFNMAAPVTSCCHRDAESGLKKKLRAAGACFCLMSSSLCPGHLYSNLVRNSDNSVL